MVHFVLNSVRGDNTSEDIPVQSAIQNGSEFIPLDHFEIVDASIKPKDFFTQFDKPFFDEIIFEQTIHNQNYRYIAWLDPTIDLKHVPHKLTLIHSSPEKERKKTEKIVGKDGVISAEEFAQLEGIFKNIAQSLFKNTVNVLPIDIKFDEEGKVTVVYKISPPVEGIVPLITDDEGLPYANQEIRDQLTKKILSFFDYPYSQKNIEKGISKLQSYFKKNKKFEHFAGLGTPEINDHNELVIPVLCKPQYLSVTLDATIADKDGHPVKNISFNPASKEIKIRYPLNERNIKELEQDLVAYFNKGQLDGHSYYVQPGGKPWADGSTLHLNYILIPMPKKIELRSDIQLNPHRLEHWFKNHKPGRKQPQYTNKSINRGLAKLDQYYQLEEGYLLKSGVEIDPETDEAMDARAVDLSYDNQKLVIGRPTPSGLTNLHFAKISKIDFEFYGKEDNPAAYAQLQDWFYTQGGEKMLRKRLDFEGRYYKHTDVANTILAIGNRTTGYSTIIDYQLDQLERSGLPDWSDHNRIDRKAESKPGGNFPVQIVWDVVPDKKRPGDVIIKVKLVRDGILISPEFGIDGS